MKVLLLVILAVALPFAASLPFTLEQPVYELQEIPATRLRRSPEPLPVALAFPGGYGGYGGYGGRYNNYGVRYLPSTGYGVGTGTGGGYPMNSGHHGYRGQDASNRYHQISGPLYFSMVSTSAKSSAGVGPGGAFSSATSSAKNKSYG